jgi:hypothetical protein
MFEVPRVDTRLRNKAEVLVLRPETIGENALPVAISVERVDGLVGETGERLPRIRTHRAFWFGWVAQYPQTVIHK